MGFLQGDSVLISPLEVDKKPQVAIIKVSSCSYLDNVDHFVIMLNCLR